MAVDVRLCTQLVPGPASVGVVPLRSNNNLDVAVWNVRVWLAWRTAPTHFASAATRFEVASAPLGPSGAVGTESLEGPWRHETTVSVGADLRESCFVEWDGQLHLYLMELGTNPFRYQPCRTHLLVNDGSGFGPPEVVWESPTVPWRVRVISGRLTYLVYTGGDKLYAARPEPTRLEAWTSTDGRTWNHDDPGVLYEGGTELDLAEMDDGSVIGSARLEGPRDWGSVVLAGSLSDPASMRRRIDARKFDSPRVFRHGSRVLMIARRNLRGDGTFDHDRAWLPPSFRTRFEQALYWTSRKRSSLWEIDPDSLAVTWLADLPSRGDTSFGAILPSGSADSFIAVDYTSPPAGPDTSWVRGQLQPTVIVASEVTLT
jgi:hypothetical protein